jgi:hypothetical protein
VKRFSTPAVLFACLAAARLAAAPPSVPPLHPKFKLLDAAGQAAIRSGRPVSTLRTCGACHDAAYIAGHSYHASLGADAPVAPGQAPSGRPWDTGTGLFGRWDPLAYGPHGPHLDLRQWLHDLGERHVGGGPAAAVGVEMDCFLCHLPASDSAARAAELRSGRFEWAATATLASTGAVRRTSNGWKWNAGAFDAEGTIADAFPRPRVSSSSNCGLCHGLVATGPAPVVLRPGTRDRSTETKGQVFSAQRLKDSGLNLAGKDGLSRPFDVHAERLLECAHCHSTLNNPAQYSGVAREVLPYLSFEPRRLAPGEYLTRPDHNLAKGHTPQGTVARQFDGSMRRCEHCHNAQATHTWLPDTRRHLQALNCESCHVPRVYAPARQQTDWTVLHSDATALVRYRGVAGDVRKASSLVAGFQPVLLPREELDGSTRLTPHNLVATWYWVAGDPPAPVALDDLRKAFLHGSDYHPEVKALLDANGDGAVDETELRLDTPSKAAAIRSRLEALGLHDPRIRGEIQPYSLHHGVAAGEWAVRQCTECHGRPSRLTAAIELAGYLPGGVRPVLVGDANVRWDGRTFLDGDGRLIYEPAAAPEAYAIGRDRWPLGDLLGALAMLAVLASVLVHGGLRIYAIRMRR